MTGLFKESLFTETETETENTETENFATVIMVEVTANKLLRDGVDPFVSATLTLMIMRS